MVLISHEFSLVNIIVLSDVCADWLVGKMSVYQENVFQSSK